MVLIVKEKPELLKVREPFSLQLSDNSGSKLKLRARVSRAAAKFDPSLGTSECDMTGGTPPDTKLPAGVTPQRLEMPNGTSYQQGKHG